MEFEKTIYEIYRNHGLKITATIAIILILLYLIKKTIELILDKVLSKRYSNKISDYENQLQRKTMAYKIILEKELAYYEKIFEYVSYLVTDIQDVEYNYEKVLLVREEQEKIKYKENFKKYILNILELIPKIKKDTILYENYSNEEISKCCTELICLLQEKFAPFVETIISQKYTKNELSRLKSITHNIIMQISILMMLIKKRQEELINI